MISRVRTTSLMHKPGIMTGPQVLTGSNNKFDAYMGYYDWTSGSHRFKSSV